MGQSTELPTLKNETTTFLRGSCKSTVGNGNVKGTYAGEQTTGKNARPKKQSSSDRLGYWNASHVPGTGRDDAEDGKVKTDRWQKHADVLPDRRLQIKGG